MKKVFAIMMLAAALAACTREEQPRIETPAPAESPATYTLTVKASKGAGTRALELVGTTLKATWDGTEKVSAQLNDGEEVGMTIDLGGQSGQASCTLKGTFSQAPKAGDVLTLKLNGNDYTNQRGTLAFIGSNCDYAEATLHVSGVNGGQIESQEGTANFVNQQAIVKFTLKDKSGAAISPSALTVKGNGDEVATVTGINANSDGVLFVAIPAISGTIELAATVGSDTYKYSRENVAFSAGEYYSITVKMTKKTSTSIDLSDESLYVNGLFTAQDGDVLTGIFPDDSYSRRIRIADGATVTLDNVSISNGSVRYAGIALEGSATIILEGKNTISANTHYPGISISNTSSTLTITGDGSLSATGGNYAAGIGCGSWNSGAEASCGSIIISGGTITATGGNLAAGIGGGWLQDGNVGNCGDITINAPAQVTANKGWNAPFSIGPSTGGHCGTVTIYGTVYEPGWNS